MHTHSPSQLLAAPLAATRAPGLEPVYLGTVAVEELGIKLSHLVFVPAWKVGGTSPLIAAMRGINDPLVPPGETAVPFLQALERLQARRSSPGK